jgi:GT2 family glycosyltransferase
MTVNPLVVAVVVNWNLPDDTTACVESLLRSTYTNHRVVIVDNGSEEACLAQIRTRFASVPLLATGENLGYAGGNNAGIVYALEQGADYVLILNNDAVVDEACISQLVRAAEDDPSRGILGPAIYYHGQHSTRFWRLGAVKQPWLPIPREIGRDEKDTGQYQTVFPVNYVTGCAMLVRGEVFAAVGLLDTSYFMYYEDADFCQRVQTEGYKIAVVPQARVWHKVSHSSQKRGSVTEYYRTRNRIVFYNRYWRGLQKLTVNGYIVAGIASKVLRGWKDRRFVVYLMRGMRDGYTRAMGKPFSYTGNEQGPAESDVK